MNGASQHAYSSYLGGVRLFGELLEKAIVSVLPEDVEVNLNAELTIRKSKVRIKFSPLYFGKDWKDVSGG